MKTKLKSEIAKTSEEEIGLCIKHQFGDRAYFSFLFERGIYRFKLLMKDFIEDEQVK